MTILRFMYDAVVKVPDHVAIEWEGGSVLYRELWAMSQSLLQRLPRRERIGLLCRRDPSAFAGIQAILSAGATCVPLNPSFPAHRNDLILSLAELDTLVVGEGCSEALAQILALQRGKRFQIVSLFPSASVFGAEVPPNVEFVQAELVGVEIGAVPPPRPLEGTAYILFTSGSTGIPKGVKIQHGNLERYFDSFSRSYPMTPDDRLSQTFDLTFDLSVHEMFLAWKSMATLVVFPEQNLSPIEFASKHRVTIWLSVPSFVAFLESARAFVPGALPDVRLSIFGGEKFTWNALQVWKKIAPNSHCVNIYGPTEVTIADFTFDIPGAYPESACHQGGIPLGKPMSGQLAEIRRADGTVCGANEEGLLWLGGDQVTAGYLDPQKTAEAFVPKEGRVWYKSGDIVFADKDGVIFFVGREDFQVKLPGGYRVELGEIEAALQRVSGAAFVIADIAKLRGDLDEIVCALPTECASRKKEIREALKDILMPHMMPKVWKFHDRLPTNANGKTDRKALKTLWLAEAGRTSG